MCGITGLWGATDEKVVRTMMERMKHRGPDADGLRVSPSGVLGHRRLSIMDPTGGDQPILSEDKERALVANGEFYNYPRLRKGLGDSHRFLTSSDSESALHLYEDVAHEAASRLDGMFAFAIADGKDLYAARDALGIKPLYMGRRSGALIFASELKALAGLAEGVREFPPGTWFHSRCGFRKFRPIPVEREVEMPLEMHLDALREALEGAVGKRLMSDVPVGAFLSGGLDSSIIAALMSRQVSSLHTFSVGMEGSRDLESARLVSDHLGTIHHEYVFTREELIEALPEVIWHLESYDRDLVRSALPCYFVSRLAARHVKVILTGEGADELFAGYRYYRDMPGEGLHDELHRSLSSLHNINLQRVDRLTMAHSLEGRVPFLDLEVIRVAQQIPARYKLRRSGDALVEKWILRRAFRDILPERIVRRTKEQFDEGSGTVEAVSRGLEHFMRRDEAEKYSAAHRAARLRSFEECVYHSLFTGFYGDSTVFKGNVARWSQRPDDRFDPPAGTTFAAGGETQANESED